MNSFRSLQLQINIAIARISLLLLWLALWLESVGCSPGEASNLKREMFESDRPVQILLVFYSSSSRRHEKKVIARRTAQYVADVRLTPIKGNGRLQEKEKDVL